MKIGTYLDFVITKEKFIKKTVRKINHLKASTGINSGFGMIFDSFHKGEKSHMLVGKLPTNAVIMYKGDKPIAWCSLNRFIGKGHTIGVYVLEDYRRMGIAKELIQYTVSNHRVKTIQYDKASFGDIDRYFEEVGITDIRDMWDDPKVEGAIIKYRREILGHIF